jgi:acyl-CoA thioester hydrolase
LEIKDHVNFSILKFQFKSSAIKVRYCETDQMGFVHHSNYLKYFELARLEWLTKLGISYKKMEEDGVLLPVIYSETKYLFPLKFDDFFFVKVGIQELPVSRLTLNYEIENHENKKICSGSVQLAFLNSKNHKPLRAPDILIFVFKKNYDL